MFKEYAADGEISERDRKMLNKMRDRMGISEERAKELIIMGFIERFREELPMEYAVELNALLKKYF